MDVRYIFETLWRRRWLMLLPALLGALVAWYILQQQPKIYKSEATLATGVIDEVKSTLIDDYGFSRPYVQEYTVDNKFTSLVEEIKSPNNLSFLAYRLFLHDVATPKSQFGNINKVREKHNVSKAAELMQMRLDSLQPLDYNKEQDKVLGEMLKLAGFHPEQLKPYINAQRYKETDNVTVIAITPNPEMSQFVVNYAIKDFIRYYGSLKLQRVQKSIDFFRKQAEEKKIFLDAKVKELNDFKIRNNIVDIQEQRNLIMRQVSDLEVRRDESTKQRESSEAAVRSYQKYMKKGDNATAEQQAKNRAIDQMRSRRDSLLNRYVASGSKDAKIKTQLDEIRSQLEDKIRDAALNTGDTRTRATTEQELLMRKVEAEIDYEEAATASRLSNAEITRLETKLGALLSQEARVATLEQQVQVSSDEYSKIVDKMENARVSMGSAVNTLLFIEEGKYPFTPEPNKQWFIVLLTFIGVLLLGALLVLLSILLDQRLRNANEFKKFSNLPVLASLNPIKFKNIDLEKLYHSVSPNTQLEIFKQFIRKTRFHVENSNGRIILVMSLNEGEGKTFYIVNLAYSLCLSGKKTLIFDMNLKNNALTQMLMNEHQQQAIANTELIRKYKLSDIFVSSRISDCGTESHVDIVGCNGGLLSPVELFSGKDMKGFFAEIGGFYDYILMEAPAFNEYPDAAELFEYADKLLVVVSAQRSLNDNDRQNLAYLETQEDKMLGVVINQSETR
ncbi:MAG: AAA family ATPase [Sphingobacteriales bacterium]|nr:AAA family ATPase [Sphingobacteriales bacterium]